MLNSRSPELHVANQFTALTIISPGLAAVLLLGRALIRRPLLTVPTMAAYFYTGTGFLATFGLAPLVAYGNYFENSLNSCIFQYENINPKPFQLWQKSEGFTHDNAALIGGIAGLFLSSRARSLQALSFGHRQIGLLGAVCAWSAAGLFGTEQIVDLLSSEAVMDQRK
jgi:hypothetical protein